MRDDEGSIYIGEYADGRITKWRIGEKTGQVIASRLRQSNFLFVDRDQSVYVTGYMTHRVVKVGEGIEEPIVAFSTVMRLFYETIHDLFYTV